MERPSISASSRRLDAHLEFVLNKELTTPSSLVFLLGRMMIVEDPIRWIQGERNQAMLKKALTVRPQTEMEIYLYCALVNLFPKWFLPQVPYPNLENDLLESGSRWVYDASFASASPQIRPQLKSVLYTADSELRMWHRLEQAYSANFERVPLEIDEARKALMETAELKHGGPLDYSKLFPRKRIEYEIQTLISALQALLKINMVSSALDDGSWNLIQKSPAIKDLQKQAELIFNDPPFSNLSTKDYHLWYHLRGLAAVILRLTQMPLPIRAINMPHVH